MTVVPTSPVWISSAPIQVHGGDLLEITGVARLPEPLIGSIDGLQIMDSLGGPDMALRIHEAPSWQPFRLIRAATSDSDLSVTIALSGLGKAQIDDVAIRVIQLPNSGPIDQAAFGPPARPWAGPHIYPFWYDSGSTNLVVLVQLRSDDAHAALRISNFVKMPAAFGGRGLRQFSPSG